MKTKHVSLSLLPDCWQAQSLYLGITLDIFPCPLPRAGACQPHLGEVRARCAEGGQWEESEHQKPPWGLGEEGTGRHRGAGGR